MASAHTEQSSAHGAHPEAKQPQSEAHHGDEHPPKGRQSWFRRLMDKIPWPKSEDFKARPLLERAKWALAGGTGVAWLHSSILFPALTLGTAAAFLTNKFILKPEAHHGSSHDSGH